MLAVLRFVARRAPFGKPPTDPLDLAGSASDGQVESTDCTCWLACQPGRDWLPVSVGTKRKGEAHDYYMQCGSSTLWVLFLLLLEVRYFVRRRALTAAGTSFHDHHHQQRGREDERCTSGSAWRQQAARIVGGAVGGYPARLHSTRTGNCGSTLT